MTAENNRSDVSDSGPGNTTSGQSIDPRESQSSEDAATRGTGEEEIFIGTPSTPASNAHPESTTHEVPIGVPADPKAFEALKRGAQRADSENTAGQLDQQILGT